MCRRVPSASLYTAALNGTHCHCLCCQILKCAENSSWVNQPSETYSWTLKNTMASGSWIGKRWPRLFKAQMKWPLSFSHFPLFYPCLSLATFLRLSLPQRELQCAYRPSGSPRPPGRDCWVATRALDGAWRVKHSLMKRLMLTSS